MSNTYFEMNTQHPNFPNAVERIDLTALVDSQDGRVQITLGRTYAILSREQTLVLAQALLARYTDISSTDDSTFPHILNLVHRRRTTLGLLSTME